MGDRFVAGSMSDPWVRVYGLEDGEERELYKGHHGPVHCVMYSPDGEMYASGSGAFLHIARILISTFSSSKILTRSLCFFRGWDYPPVADKPWEIVRLVARPAQRRLDRSYPLPHVLTLSFISRLIVPRDHVLTPTFRRLVWRSSKMEFY